MSRSCRVPVRSDSVHRSTLFSRHRQQPVESMVTFPWIRVIRESPLRAPCSRHIQLCIFEIRCRRKKSFWLAARLSSSMRVTAHWPYRERNANDPCFVTSWAQVLSVLRDRDAWWRPWSRSDQLASAQTDPQNYFWRLLAWHVVFERAAGIFHSSRVIFVVCHFSAFLRQLLFWNDHYMPLVSVLTPLYFHLAHF